MKIVDRRTFLQLPPGTIFAKYEPCVFGELCIKGPSIMRDFPTGSGGEIVLRDPSNTDDCDFWLTSLTEVEIRGGSEEFLDVLAYAETSHKSVPMSFATESRDGTFDAKQLFAVFEREDAFGLLRRLMDAFNEGYVGR